MKQLNLRTLAALTVSVALAAGTVTTVTFVTADAAFAKGNDGGNGGGNGNGGGRDNAGGKGNGGNGKSGERGTSGGKSGGDRGNSGKSDRSAGGGGFLGLFKQPQSETRRASSRAPTAAAVTTSPAPAPKPQGNSWKTRLDGELQSHPSMLKEWNSAKRSPQAIANMVAKYRETGVATGAGGMIGQFVAEYQDGYSGYNTAQSNLQTALQEAVDAGEISEERAQEILNGTLTMDSLNAEIFGLNEDLAAMAAEGAEGAEEPAMGYFIEDGMVKCDGEGCDETTLADLNGDLAALENEGIADELTSYGEAKGALDGLGMGLEEPMLSDVIDLLDESFGVALDDAGDILPPPEPEAPEEPVDEGEEPLPEGVTEG